MKEARAWVRNVLDRLDRDDIVDAAELCVSELVTNSIRHAGMQDADRNKDGVLERGEYESSIAK